MQNTTNTPAILRGEQRSNRYSYRHSVAGAAQELGIPATWIWFWLRERRLRSRTWLRKVWVRLEAVHDLLVDEQAVRDAFYATGQHLTSPEVVQRSNSQIKFQRPPKQSPRPAKAKVVSLPVSNPVLCEEEAA